MPPLCSRFTDLRAQTSHCFLNVRNELETRYKPEQIGPGMVAPVARPLQREFLSWRRK